MKVKIVVLIFLGLISSLISGIIIGVYLGRSRGIPFVDMKEDWSIGVYFGEDPFNFVLHENISNPVLTNKDITDISAEFVADPFMVKENSKWYMFFEVLNARTNQGDIGLAISDDGVNWNYIQIVLDEPFHLSYPYVFKWKNEYYLIPESNEAYSVRLYKAVDFPTQWSFVGTLLYGYLSDSSIFHYDGKWWMFTTDRNDVLRLYYADDLLGFWIEHPKSPVILGNANIARPGGRVIMFDDRIIRYAQDDDPTYGNQVWAFEIIELTTLNYEEKQVTDSPILKPSGTGWNKDGMHHIDPHQIDENTWLACVDGYRSVLVVGPKY
ncbi:MAG: hypothetical protein AM326_00170 [Candidatus Thorarchaeota archaeon SMTZ-45]|nr:MAG: hypothetical protein AM326_00170 [Candidatus Thorarchaeota archaeon SMTZ-45]